MTDRKWEALAACKNHPNPDLWFPELDAGQPNHGAEAKQICAACPVLIECLRAALDRNEENGIWGGAGADIRRGLARAYNQKDADPAMWAAAIDEHIGRLDGSVVDILNRNGPNASHGLRVTYNRGCRCQRCEFGTSLDCLRRKKVRRRKNPDQEVA